MLRSVHGCDMLTQQAFSQPQPPFSLSLSLLPPSLAITPTLSHTFKLAKSWCKTESKKCYDNVFKKYHKKEGKEYDGTAWDDSQSKVNSVDMQQFCKILLHFEKNGEMNIADDVKGDLKEKLKGGGKSDRKANAKGLKDPQIEVENVFGFIVKKGVQNEELVEATAWMESIVGKLSPPELSLLRKRIKEAKKEDLTNAAKEKLMGMHCVWVPVRPLREILTELKGGSFDTKKDPKVLSKSIREKTKAGVLDGNQLVVLRALIKESTYWDKKAKSKLLGLDVIKGKHLTQPSTGISGVDYVVIPKQDMDYRRWKIVRFFGNGLHQEKANLWTILGKAKTIGLNQLLNIDIKKDKATKKLKLDGKGYDGTTKSAKKAAFQEELIKHGMQTLNDHVKETNLKGEYSKSVRSLVESSTGIGIPAKDADWQEVLEIAGVELLAGLGFIGQEMIDGVIPSPALIWTTFKSVKEAWKGSKNGFDNWRARELIKIAPGHTADITAVLDKSLTLHIVDKALYSFRKIGGVVANVASAGAASVAILVVGAACKAVLMAINLKRMIDDRKKFSTLVLAFRKELVTYGQGKKLAQPPIWTNPKAFRTLLSDNLTPSLAAFLMASGHFLVGDLGCFCELTQWGPEKMKEYKATCKKLMGLRDHAKYIIRETDFQYKINSAIPEGPERDDVVGTLQFVYADREEFFKKRVQKLKKKELKKQREAKEKQKAKKKSEKIDGNVDVVDLGIKKKINYDRFAYDDDDDDQAMATVVRKNGAGDDEPQQVYAVDIILPDVK